MSEASVWLSQMALDRIKEDLERAQRIESLRKVIRQFQDLGFLGDKASLETITLAQLEEAYKKLEATK